jgi:hypothetical protein
MAGLATAFARENIYPIIESIRDTVGIPNLVLKPLDHTIKDHADTYEAGHMLFNRLNKLQISVKFRGAQGRLHVSVTREAADKNTMPPFSQSHDFLANDATEWLIAQAKKLISNSAGDDNSVMTALRTPPQ